MDRQTLSLLIWIVAVLAATWVQSLFLARLRKLHPVTWSKLFSSRDPVLFGDESADPRLLTFLTLRQYRALPDMRLMLLGDATNVAWLIVLLTMAFWALIAGPTSGPPIY